MKKLNILFIALSLFAFVACDNEGDHLTLNNTELVTPTFEMNSQQDFVVKASTDQNEVVGNWKWTQASFGVDSPITYSIVADTLSSFESEVEVARYTTYSKEESITIKLLNDAASALTKESKPVKLYVALKAFIGTTGALSPLYSEVKTITFTCYYFNPKDILYIVGDGLVGWGNDAANIGKDLQLFFANNSGKTDLIYTYTGQFLGGKGLKFPTKAGDWDTAYGYNGSSLVANGGDNFPTPDANGLYTLTANLETLAISITPYTGAVDNYNVIGIVGDAANGWPSDDNVTDVEMTQVVPHVWVATNVDLKEGKEMKFRANKDWGKNWGAQNGDNQEFPFAVGKDGGDNIKIIKTGKYFVAFNDLTKQYIIVLEDNLPKK